MGLNRFSITGTSEYTPQHVPLPFEEISAIGEKMQKKYDTAIDDTYKLKDLMAQVPAINDPNEGLSNIKKKAELDVKYHPRIEEITNKIASGDSNAYAELEKVKRDFINDPDRQELVSSYDNYKAYKEDKIKKGDKYAPWENPYLNQQLVDPNTGELKPFRYSGMGEVQDHQKLSDEMMKGFVESSNEFKNARLGEDGIIRTNFGKGAAITDAQIRNAANAKIIDFVGNKEGMSFLKQMKFQYPDATPEQLQQAVSDKLYHSGMNQIHNNSGGGNIIDVTSTANDLRKEQKEFAGSMPTFENPVQGLGSTATAKSGLGWLGFSTDILNEDGSFNSKAYESKGTDLIKDVKENIKDGSVIVTDIYGNKTTHKTLVDAYSEFKKKSAPSLLGKHYMDLINKAKGLGLEIPKKSTDKNATDFKELQKQLADYGQNMQLQGNTTAGFQARFATNLSNYFLGSVSTDASGNITFKKSPLLDNGKITDQSTGETISENKEELAQDGTLKGINYFAPEVGTYKMVSKGKSYDYHPGDGALNAMTQNTHSLTQDIVKARQGKQGYSTVLEPATTGVDADGNVINIPAKTVGDYANSIVNGLKENFRTIPANNPQGLILANHLNENLTKLNGYEPVSIKTSDILISEGPRKNTPKYNYVAYEHKGFGTTNEADDKILRIDAESGQTEVMTLGDIQANERDYLQKNYAGAFEPTK